MQNNLTLLRPAAVCKMLSISGTTLRRWSKLPDFPSAVKIGSRAIAYDQAEIEAYLKQRKEVRN